MRKYRRKKFRINRKLVLIIAIIIFIYSIFFDDGNYEFLNNIDINLNNNINLTTSVNEPIYNTQVTGELQVYFIDVGQADSILVRTGDEAVLIDAGNNSDGKLLTEYIKSLGIYNFKVVVATHAHEDHIGGMSDIINNFNIDDFYMPNAVISTATFENMLSALENKNLSVTIPNIGDTFTIGEGLFQVIYVGDDEDDLNNSSIVLKLNYGKNSILFMGDATNEVEKQILNSNIKSDVLKVGHHGSQYSTSNDFLNRVNPKYAIISCGKKNIYGHPKQVTLNKLKNKNIIYYRTDEKGTIILTSDGENINFEFSKTNTNGG